MATKVPDRNPVEIAREHRDTNRARAEAARQRGNETKAKEYDDKANAFERAAQFLLSLFGIK